MQAYYNNMSLFNFNHMEQQTVPSQSYQHLLTLNNKLQQMLLKQQVLIDALTVKQQQTEEKLQESLSKQRYNYLPVKQEFGVSSSDDDYYSHGDCKQEFETDNERPRIIRRNGFKTPISDDESSVSGKSKKSRRIPSKAKHLWINYGRRIIEYGIENTEGPMQEKIRQLFGKLSSKKEYKDVFGLSAEDTEEERQFKVELGTMAIEFVKNKSAATFEGTKHKDEMVAQWNAVVTYIEKLIN